MPFFAVHYTYADQPDAIAEGRPNHRAYLRSLADQGLLRASGPLVGRDRDQALLLFNAPDAGVVSMALAGDPFQIDGLVESYDVTEWKPVVGVFADEVG
jgi:uncharacterized protein